MNRSRWQQLAIVAGTLALMAVPTSRGQVGYGVGVRRATANAPSQFIDRIGGRYTYEDVAGLPQRGDVARVNAALGLPRTSRHGGAPELAPVRLGPVTSPYRFSLANAGLLSTAQLEYASGFSYSTSVGMPVEGLPGLNELPWSELPVLPPQPAGGRFHQAFGLRPAERKPAASEAVPSERLWSGVESATKRGVSETQEQAFELYREATSAAAQTPEHHQKIRRAERLLASACALDAEAHVPHLLMAHAALDQGHRSVALQHLIVATARRPEILRERPDLASHFGDFQTATGRSPYLEAQMRQVLQQATSEMTADGHVLSAYCAWALGEAQRARAALDKADELLVRGKRASRGLDQLIHALRYAL